MTTTAKATPPHIRHAVVAKSRSGAGQDVVTFATFLCLQLLESCQGSAYFKSILGTIEIARYHCLLPCVVPPPPPLSLL